MIRGCQEEPGEQVVMTPAGISGSCGGEVMRAKRAGRGGKPTTDKDVVSGLSVRLVASRGVGR